MSRRGRFGGLAAILTGLFAVLTVVVVVTGPGVFGVDASVASRLHRPVVDHPALGPALRLIGLITEPFWWRLIALVSAVALWRRGRRRAAGWLVLTMTAGGLLGVALKEVFTRGRPVWPDAITVVSGYSFPSGHALNSMLAAGCLIVLVGPKLGPAGRQRLGLAAIAFILVIGLDRLALGVHYLTDVLAGWTLALAVLFTALAAYDPATEPAPDREVARPPV